MLGGVLGGVIHDPELIQQEVSIGQTVLSQCICSRSKATTRRKSGLRGKNPEESGSQWTSPFRHHSLPRSVDRKSESEAV